MTSDFPVQSWMGNTLPIPRAELQELIDAYRQLIARARSWSQS